MHNIQKPCKTYITRISAQNTKFLQNTKCSKPTHNAQTKRTGHTELTQNTHYTCHKQNQLLIIYTTHINIQNTRLTQHVHKTLAVQCGIVLLLLSCWWLLGKTSVVQSHNSTFCHSIEVLFLCYYNESVKNIYHSRISLVIL